MNHYSPWKYFLIGAVVVLGFFYALPNLFGDSPSIQISGTRDVQINQQTLQRVRQLLDDKTFAYQSVVLENKRLLIRFDDTDVQLNAKEVIREQLGRGYVVALNLAPATPQWLRNLGALPMVMGLDLRGGVHFLMEVDMEAALSKAAERYVGDLRVTLRTEKIRYQTLRRKGDEILLGFRTEALQQQAYAVIRQEYDDLQVRVSKSDNTLLRIKLIERAVQETRKFAIQQNMTTLRNRVNELGVAEPVIQQQGSERIVIQLPGVQDTAKAKEILGATATLEFRLVDEEHDLDAAVAGKIPPGSKLYYFRSGRPLLVKRRVIVTGDRITSAASSIDSQNGGPMVSISLDGVGGRKMLDTTKRNVGNRMAVVFIENRTETEWVDGEPVRRKIKTQDIINAAVIREQFANRFQITGLDSTDEARTLALLLRAGALAAPVEIVEERTVGPSLGKDNIAQGFQAVIAGFVLVLIFMAWRYKTMGMVANMALTLNLVLMVAVLSLLQATLTLPGIAGIVLTVGMAVDANVLIFERIREELLNGNSPQASIHAGYEKAFSTIADANITTLIASLVLFSFGTGPIKGFAITLSIGILTSMFTAIMGTRSVVNLIYGRRRVGRIKI